MCAAVEGATAAAWDDEEEEEKEEEEEEWAEHSAVVSLVQGQLALGAKHNR
jgi:hypothetical protein